MQAEEIEIKISENGDITFHVKGVKGKGCSSLTEAMEKALGTVKNRTFTTDYYDPGDVHAVDQKRLDLGRK